LFNLGVPPRIMGVGPVYAIPLALKNAGLELRDVDLFEVRSYAHLKDSYPIPGFQLNEAFASQCVYCIKALDLPRYTLHWFPILFVLRAQT